MKIVAGILVGLVIGAFTLRASCSDWNVLKSCTLDTPYKSFTVIKSN